MDGCTEEEEERAGGRGREGNEALGGTWALFVSPLCKGAMGDCPCTSESTSSAPLAHLLFFFLSTPIPTHVDVGRQRKRQVIISGVSPFFVAHPGRVLFLTCASFFLPAICLSQLAAWPPSALLVVPSHAQGPEPSATRIATP